LPRKLDNWLRGYQLYTEGTESPPIFHFWCALGTLAGAAQRKIVLDEKYFQVYPNMYIVLVSPPGRSRKSTALRIGKGLLKGVIDYGQEVHFSTQASSVAALVKQFSSISNKDHQSMTAFISELGSLLGSKSVEMTDFLTDVYDCEPDWDKQTVGRGLEKIERPWFNLLGATTPQWMGDNLSKTAVEGGFVSRTVFVFDDTRLRVAFPDLTDEQRVIRRSLIHDLAEIAKIQGEFKFSDEAKDFYSHWYEHVLPRESQSDYRLTGFFERKHIHVKKVAMLMRLAQGSVETKDHLIISKTDIEAAIGVVGDIEPGMRKAFSAVGKNVYSTDLDRILEQIRNGGYVSYRELIAGNIHSVDKEVLDKILGSLISMEEIEMVDGKYSPKIPKYNGGREARVQADAETEEDD
jgi:hypothetical protein